MLASLHIPSILLFLLLLLLNPAKSTLLFESCDKQCQAGICTFSNCHGETPPSCPGGACYFSHSASPKCSGGGCVFVKSDYPSCSGGGCSFFECFGEDSVGVNKEIVVGEGDVALKKSWGEMNQEEKEEYKRMLSFGLPKVAVPLQEQPKPNPHSTLSQYQAPPQQKPLATRPSPDRVYTATGNTLDASMTVGGSVSDNTRVSNKVNSEAENPPVNDAISISRQREEESLSDLVKLREEVRVGNIEKEKAFAAARDWRDYAEKKDQLFVESVKDDTQKVEVKEKKGEKKKKKKKHDKVVVKTTSDGIDKINGISPQFDASTQSSENNKALSFLALSFYLAIALLTLFTSDAKSSSTESSSSSNVPFTFTIKNVNIFVKTNSKQISTLLLYTSLIQFTLALLFPSLLNCSPYSITSLEFAVASTLVVKCLLFPLPALHVMMLVYTIAKLAKLFMSSGHNEYSKLIKGVTNLMILVWTLSDALVSYGLADDSYDLILSTSTAEFFQAENKDADLEYARAHELSSFCTSIIIRRIVVLCVGYGWLYLSEAGVDGIRECWIVRFVALERFTGGGKVKDENDDDEDSGDEYGDANDYRDGDVEDFGEGGGYRGGDERVLRRGRKGGNDNNIIV